VKYHLQASSMTVSCDWLKKGLTSAREKAVFNAITGTFSILSLS